jgi:NADPH:quinone reductase-like Zn-dependent oxidoreductase
MVVLVTGAAGNIAYSIIFMICHGGKLSVIYVVTAHQNYHNLRPA